MRIFIVLLLITVQSAYAQKFVRFRLGSASTSSACYSPDLSHFVFNEGSTINFYTAGTTTEAKQFRVSKADVTKLKFNEDGTLLLVVSGESVAIVDPVSGLALKTTKGTDNIVDAGFLSGKKIAFATEKSLTVYDFETAAELYSKSDHLKAIRALATTKDGSNIITVGGDGKLIIYNAIDGKIKVDKKIHEGWIRCVDVDPDGELIATGNDDGSVDIHDIKGEPYGKFDDGKGWISAVKFSEDGKYIASGDDKGICYIYSVERKLLSQKIEELSKPVSAMAFRNDGKELAIVEELKGTRVLDVTALNISPVFKIKDTKDNNPPQILVSNPPNIQNDRYRYSQDLISIKGIVIDDSGVRSLMINGIKTPLKDNGNFVLHFPLSMGDNYVTIEAVDVNGNIAVKKFIITRKDLDGEEYDAKKARNFLFVVGINDYEKWPKLNNAVKDASDVASVLLSQYTFDFSNVIMLKNEQATRSNIYKSLRSLIEQITPQDNLVIYYSGHGHYDELLNEGYWVPVEAHTGSTGDYLSNSDLLKIIGTINSQHTLLVADACFSGSLFSDSKRGYAENVEKFKSRWGLASGRLEVVSDGNLNENSPFTSTVLEFLKTNQNEKFPASEMIQYVKVKVAEKAAQTPLGNPLKGAGDEGGEFVFYKK